jgi:rRNA pseudouridine-1189 N-methylase Emg1 (Nep1/Mra1 family)
MNIKRFCYLITELLHTFVISQQQQELNDIRIKKLEDLLDTSGKEEKH